MEENTTENIYVAYNDDGDILCAWTDEDEAKKDCKESGVNYEKTTLYRK